MKVHPRELVPGCLIIKDVMGKTTYPIIPKNTVVEEEHIEVLLKFQIPYVDVAKKLVNGKIYRPKEVYKDAKKQKPVTKKKEVSAIIPKRLESFYDHYVEAVRQTKELFQNWDEHSEIDLVSIRNMLFPLIELSENQTDIIIQLHHYTDKHDYFFHHIVSMSVLSAYLAKHLKYDKNERLQIALAAYLSDIGMLSIDKDLYFKERVLTEEEFEQVKKHPILSYRLIEHSKFLSNNVKLAILQHHERLDGTGYPLKLTNEKIHPFAKIIAVSDTFHAMTSERFYKKKKSPFKVVEELRKHQFGKLDMKIIMELMNCFVKFSTQRNVRLSNNEVGKIVFIDQNNPTRPIIQLENKQLINLVEYQELYIDEVLQ